MDVVTDRATKSSGSGMRVCALTRCAPPTHVAWYGDSFAKLANLAAQTSEMEVVWVTGRAFAASKRMEVAFFVGLNLNLGKRELGR